MRDFSTLTPGTIPSGTVTPLGTVQRSSLTAYLVDGRWVPFHLLHGEQPWATPLVVLG